MTIGYHLVQIHRRTRRYLDMTMIDKAGITCQQARILGAIVEGNTNQKELEKELFVRRSTISGIIDTMEKHGLVMRVSNPMDKRSNQLVPTRKGLETAKLCHGVIQEMDEKIDQSLGEEQVKSLHRMLDTIDTTLEAMHA